MLIGVLSDSHDNVPLIRKALGILKEKGAELLLHAGDFVAPFAVKVILESFERFLGVFGNNDGEKLLLNKISQGNIKEGPRIEVIQDKKIFLAHDLPFCDSLAKSGDFDLIITGHTHLAQIRRIGSALVLNPGELGGWLYGKSTFGMVDLDTMEAEIIELT